MISNDDRPLTTSTWRLNGKKALRERVPQRTLSTALCRPTSSRTTSKRPVSSKSAAACRPPVRSKARWARRIASGIAAITSRRFAGRRRSAIGSSRVRIASIVALPHRPQLDAANTWRVRFSKSNGTSGSRTASTKLPTSSSATNEPIQNVRPSPHDSFRDQEARSQFDIVLGGPHGHADRPPADANFERLFGNQFVVFGPGQSVIPPDEGRCCEHAHDSVNRGVSEGGLGGASREQSNPAISQNTRLTTQSRTKRVRFPCHPNSSR